MGKLKYIILFSVLLVISCNEKKQSSIDNGAWTFYLGTYTDQDSEGIYEFEIKKDGSFENKGLRAKCDNPSYLVISEDKKFLIAVQEVDNDNRGGLSSYLIHKDSLERIHQSESGGAHPCHISIDENDNILVSNYSGGNATLLRLEGQGKLIMKDIKQHEGNSIIEDRQSAPHVHSSYFLGDNQILSVDLGTDALWLSKIDKGKEQFIDSSTFQLHLPPGSGPRHMTFDQSKSNLYVVNELNSSISHFNNANGKYTLIDNYPTLPDSIDINNYCADIHLSKNGNFLYASNRGHNSIVIYKVHDEGNLEYIAHENIRGDWPRNFAFSPDGNFMVVANQYSNNLVSFQIDPDSGLLEFVDSIEAPSPVCIQFFE